MTGKKKALFALTLGAAFALATAIAAAQEHGGGHGETATQGGHGEHGEAATAHEGGGEHAAAHEGHEGHGPAPLNIGDIWDKQRPAIVALFINFGLLVGLYYTLGKKPISEALRQRRVTIGKDIEDAQKMLDEAIERAKKYQGDLKNADVDATTAKSALVAAAKGDVERVLREAEEKVERMKRDADRLIEQERKQVHEDLLRETVDRSVEEAMKILEKNVTADDHARLAQDLLGELAARPGAKAGSVAPPRAGGVS